MFTPGTKLVKALKVMLAVDGKYEEALHFYAPYQDYSKDDVEKLLSNFSQSVSIEFFYETSDGRNSYLGIKYKPETMTSMDAKEFVRRSLNTFADDPTFEIFVPAIGMSLNNNRATFLNSRPSQIELGVNEWWFTFGPLLIWKDGEPVLKREDLKDKLANREDLRINPKNFVGAEVIFMSPIEHWLTTQVSELEQNKYLLNIDQVLAATSSIN
jgi:hypothetical protein